MRDAGEFAERVFQGAQDAEVCVDMRSADLVCDAADGGREYGTALEDLDRYFLAFAVVARRGR